MSDRIDEKIDEMFQLRERKREMESEIKAINADIEECTKWLLAKYQEVGTVTARGKLASATITEQLVPTIDDWGKVQDYVLENDALYLLHRRISSGAWKELIDTGEVVPGITPFTKKSISLRKLGV